MVDDKLLDPISLTHILVHTESGETIVIVQQAAPADLNNSTLAAGNFISTTMALAVIPIVLVLMKELVYLTLEVCRCFLIAPKCIEAVYVDATTSVCVKAITSA